MKIKKIQKKLTLNKETISRIVMLEEGEKNKLFGGGGEIECSAGGCTVYTSCSPECCDTELF
ncbi:MAG: hypothetical protein GY940_18580 [bacterium]|nr:hypothetical protein [bacterium]